MNYDEKHELVPVWRKYAMTLEEANAYTGVSRNVLTKIIENPECDFVLRIGTKRLVKREKLVEYINGAYSL